MSAGAAQAPDTLSRPARRALSGQADPGHASSAQPGSSAAEPNAATADLSADVAVLLLVNFARAARLWAWSRLVRGPQALAGTPGLRFAKVLGSGHHGGFGLKPSATRQGLFVVFADEFSAQDFLCDSPCVAQYRAHAEEFCVVVLRATSCRGRWSGHDIGVGAPPQRHGPVAALTRASIRPGRALAFWRYAPASQQALEQAPGCILAAGLGEAPLLRQATFSIWQDAAAMNAYARHGPHQQAIAAAGREGYFSESMFVRFVPLSIAGTWQGRQHG